MSESDETIELPDHGNSTIQHPVKNGNVVAVCQPKVNVESFGNLSSPNNAKGVAVYQPRVERNREAVQRNPGKKQDRTKSPKGRP